MRICSLCRSSAGGFIVGRVMSRFSRILRLTHVKLITNLELSTVALFFQLRTFFQAQTAPDNIVVVAICEASMQEFNQPWPWSRRVHGDLVSVLKKAGAAVMIFAVVFSEP